MFFFFNFTVVVSLRMCRYNVIYTVINLKCIYTNKYLDSAMCLFPNARMILMNSDVQSHWIDYNLLSNLT